MFSTPDEENLPDYSSWFTRKKLTLQEQEISNQILNVPATGGTAASSGTWMGCYKQLRWLALAARGTNCESLYASGRSQYTIPRLRRHWAPQVWSNPQTWLV